MRLSRASGLKGLSAMSQESKIDKQINLYPPLLDIKKEYLIKITKLIFGKFVKDPSNKDKKFLRTKVRNLKKPLEKSGIKYEQIFKSIKNLSSSKETLDRYFNIIFKKMIKKKGNEIKIDFNKYNNLSKDTKIAIINVSIKQLKENYYDLRTKKIENLIKNLEEDNFKKYTLGGCIFFKKGKDLCLILEKSYNT